MGITKISEWLGLASESEKANNSLFLVLKKLFELLKVPVHSSSIQRFLEVHPKGNSVIALSDALFNWNVKNIYAELPPEYLNEELPLPSIVVLENERAYELCVVTSIKDGRVVFYNSLTESTEESSVETFRSKWNGEIILSESAVFSGEKIKSLQFKESQFLFRTLDRYTIRLILVGLFVSGLLVNSLFLLKAAWVLKVLGLGFSLALIAKELNFSNPFLEKICRSNSPKLSCDAVLNSGAAKYFTWIKLSEIGLLYFSGGLLALLFFSQSLVLVTGLKLIALLALPFALFSLFYQGFILKRWCPLCVAVQIVLILESLLFFSSSFYFDLSLFNLVFFSYAIPLLIVLLVRPHLGARHSISNLSEQLNWFRTNWFIFKKFSEETDNVIQFTPFEDEKYLIGSADAEIKVVLGLSFHCGGCRLMAEELKYAPELFDNVSVAFRWKTESTKDEEIERIMLSYFIDNPKRGMEAMLDWFEMAKLNKKGWLEKYPMLEHIPETEIQQEIAKHHKWFAEAAVEHTPILLVNDRILPAYYRSKDVKFHLRYLSENAIAQE